MIKFLRVHKLQCTSFLRYWSLKCYWHFSRIYSKTCMLFSIYTK